MSTVTAPARPPFIPVRPDVESLPPPARRSLLARAGLGLLEGLAVLLYAVGWLLAAVLVPVGLAGRWVWAGLACGWSDCATVQARLRDER